MGWIRRMPLSMLIAACARQAAAQQPQPAGCGFDRCGLLVVSPGAAIGATTTGERRAFTWAFVPHIPDLEEAGTASYGEYRRAQRLYGRSSIVQVAGFPAVLGVIYYISTDPRKRPWKTSAEGGVVGVAVGTTLIDAPLEGRAAEHLSRAAWLHSRPATPQRPDSSGCTYDRCALRFRYGAWSTRLAQGLDGTPVAAPRDLFAHAGDSARAHYERYLALHHGARWVGPAVLAALVGSVAALHTNDPTVRGVGVGFLVVGYAVGHLSLGAFRQERTELEAAIWEYNRDLAR